MHDDTILRHGDLVAVPTEESVMFMDLDAGQYRMLTGTGRDIWLLVDGDRSVGDIVGALVERYDVDPATCDGEVKAFLGSLCELGMVEVAR